MSRNTPAADVLALLERPPLREGSAVLQHRRWWRDAAWLLEWLGGFRGATWQQRWLASGAERCEVSGRDCRSRS